MRRRQDERYDTDCSATSPGHRRLTVRTARRTIPHMTSPTTAPLDAAHALVPALAAREQATMMARHIPPETIADFHRTGILRLTQPRRFGGQQASFGVFSRVIEILAEGCAVSAWVYAVLGEHQWIIACMPLQAQENANTPITVVLNWEAGLKK